MNANNQQINADSLMQYIGDAGKFIPGFKAILKQSEDEYPAADALGISSINLERLTEELADKGITTFMQLDKKLEEHEAAITAIFKTLDSEYIASHSTSLPIYLLLEVIANETSAE